MRVEVKQIEEFADHFGALVEAKKPFDIAEKVCNGKDVWDAEASIWNGKGAIYRDQKGSRGVAAEVDGLQHQTSDEPL